MDHIWPRSCCFATSSLKESTVFKLFLAGIERWPNPAASPPFTESWDGHPITLRQGQNEKKKDMAAGHQIEIRKQYIYVYTHVEMQSHLFMVQEVLPVEAIKIEKMKKYLHGHKVLHCFISLNICTYKEGNQGSKRLKGWVKGTRGWHATAGTEARCPHHRSLPPGSWGLIQNPPGSSTDHRRWLPPGPLG